MGIYLQKFCRITAIWARVAVPRGDRVWVPVPEIRPLPRPTSEPGEPRR